MHTKKYVFSGVFRDCLRHYVEAHGNSQETRTIVADFVGVQEKIVRKNWFTLKHLPTGERFVKLSYFLILNGYDVEEFRNLDEITRDIGYMVALKFVTFADLMEQTGYAPSSLRHALTTPSFRATEEKRLGMENLRDRHKDELDHALHAFIRDADKLRTDNQTERNEKSIGSKNDAGVLETLQSVRHELDILKAQMEDLRRVGNSEDGYRHKVSLSTIGLEVALEPPDWTILAAVLLNAVAPILRELNGDVDEDTRKRFRNLLGDDGMFRIANLFTSLCGERAKRIVKSK